MPDADQTTPLDRAVEAAAEQLWHRFAPSHAMEWRDETHAAEYRLAARDAVVTFLRTLPGYGVGRPDGMPALGLSELAQAVEVSANVAT